MGEIELLEAENIKLKSFIKQWESNTYEILDGITPEKLGQYNATELACLCNSMFVVLKILDNVSMEEAGDEQD